MDLPDNPEQFASDNCAGMCPVVLEYVVKANGGSASAYGQDEWTQGASGALRALFETDCEVFFLGTGTVANSLALAALCRPYQGVICHESAHIATDECGAPEFFSGGSKLLLGKGPDGKLTPASVDALISAATDVHSQAPGAMSLTQLTESGTVYSLDELSALASIAKRHGLKIHMDGARFANAVATLDVTPAEASWKMGVDVLCFGGSKNGMGIGEAILFFDRDLAAGFAYRCKQAGQLVSKMRFVAASWLGLLESGAWLDNARHANQCAAYLENRLRLIEGVELRFPRQGNALFIKLPQPVVTHLYAQRWQFYNFFEEGVIRLMCSWSSTQSRIDQLVADIEAGMRAMGA